MGIKKYSLNLDELESIVEVNIEGIDFKIKGYKDKSYYQKLDTEKTNVIDEELEYILGENCIEKINEARKLRNKEELDFGLKLNMLLKLIEFNIRGSIQETENTANTMLNNIQSDVNNLTNQFANREQRRNYSRNYNRNYNRNNYRRRY